MVRRKHIRALAEKLLTEHNVRTGPVDVAKLARAIGVQVQEQPADDDLSGFLYRNRRRKTAVIGVNSTQHVNRRRFTTAHELGHYLLHDFDEVHVDRQFKVWLRNEASSQGIDLEEREANLFAAEILMPARFIERDVQKIGMIDLMDEEVIAKLAIKYGVSTQAMMFRLGYLGYVEQ
jgi:Zn-dependent peptidase ImmA (M78 family)